MSDDTTNLAIFDFKMEAKNIIAKLDALYKERERQIRFTFTRLFDNLSGEIRDTPINECLEAYYNFVKSEDSFLQLQKSVKKAKDSRQAEKQEEKKADKSSIVTIVDDSVVIEEEVVGGSKARSANKHADETTNIDFENFNQFSNNLTSTVKKSNPIKPINKLFANKLNTMLSEEMIIPKDDQGEETYYNAEETALHGQSKIMKQTHMNEMTITSEAIQHSADFALKLVYYLKDGSEARVNLKDLKSINMENVHTACVNELKMAIVNNS